jgi:hypothetical protein
MKVIQPTSKFSDKLENAAFADCPLPGFSQIQAQFLGQPKQDLVANPERNQEGTPIDFSTSMAH